jgi:hypothetical protein
MEITPIMEEVGFKVESGEYFINMFTNEEEGIEGIQTSLNLVLITDFLDEVVLENLFDSMDEEFDFIMKALPLLRSAYLAKK